ncbi:DsbA family protein [Arthrobacter burdickii]|uniref:Thioredoxin domain-containing protein n=1 Tax=Arthrobacter burdickii TaxID=3035920 RepID=A0ABT8JVW2_9MICC|nr:thioredoxin domain-containing protein [Arthrobacter burdickii]MDN4609308.1 thioredoxin domain-containing protein [Arthrobacter burdickii]
MPTPAPASSATLGAKNGLSVQNRIAIGLLAAAALVIGLVILFNTLGEDESQAAGTSGTAASVVREDSHRLSQAPDEKAVLVEFLDFECESCLAAYPLVEDLSEEYGQNLTVASRYFPLPGHPNSETAAAAVEAAAQQGRFKDMHAHMYETQTEWSHTSEDRSPVFRGYAEDLGLDMAAYDAAIADPATMERVNADKADGMALNVEGTPTFFLDGRKIQPATVEEFRSLIETAIAD